MDPLPRLDALLDVVHGEDGRGELEPGVRDAALRLGMPLGHHAQAVDRGDLLFFGDGGHD